MVDRRQVVAFLLGVLGAASTPALFAPRRTAFVLKRWSAQGSAQTNAFAEDKRGVIYLVRAVVTGMHKVADGCWIWAVEHDEGHNVFSFCDDASRDTIAVVEIVIPETVIGLALEQWSAGNLTWEREIIGAAFKRRQDK
jgi:hypothetical protein